MPAAPELPAAAEAQAEACTMTTKGKGAGNPPPAPSEKPAEEAAPDAAAEAEAWLAKRKAAPAVPVSKAPPPIKPIRMGNYVAPPPKPAPWSAPPPPPPLGSVPAQAPREWVPLAHVPGWVLHLYGQDDPELLAWLTIAARSPHLFLTRIPNVEPRNYNLPAGLALSREYGESRVYGANWDEATKECPPGEVNGWDGQRHPILLMWAHVERWLPQYRAEARTRQRERDAAAAAEAKAPECPAGWLPFPKAVDRVARRLSVSDDDAIAALVKALAASDCTARKRPGTMAEQRAGGGEPLPVPSVSWADAGPAAGGLLRFLGRAYHPNWFTVSEGGFSRWLDGQAPEAPEPAEGVADSPAPLLRSGAQGKPSSMKNLVAPELARRRDAGETLESVAAEARALSRWLSETHPRQPQASAKAIQNSLRSDLRAAIDEVSMAKQRPK